ncbi:MAG: helix-turn-helix transcriptional regulator [Pseudomonadota bacterium]
MRTQFAQDLRLARRQAGYTQDDLAHLLDSHQSLVSDLEQGRQRPNLEQIVDLSLIYGRSFESFFAALLAERQRRLIKRLATLPALPRPTAHTFNRSASLTRLRARLKQPPEHGGA